MEADLRVADTVIMVRRKDVCGYRSLQVKVAKVFVDLIDLEQLALDLRVADTAIIV